MNYTKAQRFWWFIYWLFLVVSFCIVGFLLVTQAMGYRYNTHQHRYQKTGMVIITNPPDDSQLSIDGKEYSLRSTTRIPNILPGTYRLAITKPGYHPWLKTVTIDPGFVANIERVSLYLEKPIELEDPSKYVDLVPFYSVRDNRLRLEDGEIWFDSKLVSRFDTAPSDALLLPNDHIAYLHGDEVRIIESNGENDQLLYKRQTADATVFALIDGILVFNDISGTKAIQIQ
jgi:hypothetical protein